MLPDVECYLPDDAGGKLNTEMLKCITLIAIYCLLFHFDAFTLTITILYSNNIMNPGTRHYGNIRDFY